MSNANKDAAMFDVEELALLALAQGTRKKIVEDLMKEGLPKQTSDKVMLIQALDGIDRAIFTKAKIKSDDKNSKSQQEITRMVANMLTTMGGKQQSAPPRIDKPSTDHIEIPNTVPGETDITNEPVSYEEVMSAK